MHIYENVTKHNNMRWNYLKEERLNQWPSIYPRLLTQVCIKTLFPHRLVLWEDSYYSSRTPYAWHHGSNPPLQLEKNDNWKVWCYQWPGRTPWRVHHIGKFILHRQCIFLSSIPSIAKGTSPQLVHSLTPLTPLTRSILWYSICN